ncbi:MAG TPA: histidinol-phosphatase HisJ family protein [Clostridiaceae bacterium]|nr:histidinol-phosphatase HisJ family protein [Clostridiaceae bacterium]
MIDCHVHSNFSPDGKMPIDTACQTAADMELTGIAFTDHFDIDYPYPDLVFMFEPDKYFEDIEKIKNKYKDRIKVLAGIEIGLMPDTIDENQKIVSQYNFDYVLASVHVVDGMDPYMLDYYNNKTKHRAYERYLEEIHRIITLFDDFDMFAHFDYVIRPASYDDRSLRYRDHSDILDSIFKELISKGKGFEINTGSYRDRTDGKKLAEYDINILKRYKELGGELVCLGSDGHNPEHIGLKFSQFSELIKEAGFKYMVHFEQRKPVLIKI